MARVLSGARLVTGDGVLDDGVIQIEGGRIGEVSAGPVPQGAAEDLDGAIVMTGFVDQHCHGGGGADFAAADPEEVRTAAATHLAHGTTTLVASLVTASTADLLTQIDAVRPLVHTGVVGGIHLEGPWLSREQCGAHDESQLRAPDADEVDTLLGAGGGTIRMVTLAPELPGGIAAIRRIVADGVVVAIGHTAADFDTTVAAIDAGATVATHLLNRMPVLHKREPGPVLALMRDGRVTCELIIDGVHLHPGIVEFVIDHVGPGRVAAVTDAMAAAGVGDGAYAIGELDVEVIDGVARLTTDVEPGMGALAGSALTADVALRMLVDSCGQDLVAASQMLSATPARAMGFTDRGRVEPGLRADLVVLDENLQVMRVMREGQWVA